MSHSKSTFTAHERDVAKAAWSSTSARLTRESFLPFGSCCLCLELARDPVCCPRGDMFCRECALSNLLAQKKEAKRRERAQKHAEYAQALAQARQDADTQKQAVKDFERTQAGLDPGQRRENVLAPPLAGDDGDVPKLTAGSKRKFVLDEEELVRIAREDHLKTRKTMDEEKLSKGTLPSFWAPSQTPNAEVPIGEPNSRLKSRLAPSCPAASADNSHPFSLKSLIPVNFSNESNSRTTNPERTCPSCLKVLSNSSRPLLAKVCGHVVCRNCVLKFTTPLKPESASAPDSTCYVCGVQLVPGPQEHVSEKQKTSFPGLIELRSEGTGFSAGGPSKVGKSGVAFHC